MSCLASAISNICVDAFASRKIACAAPQSFHGVGHVGALLQRHRNIGQDTVGVRFQQRDGAALSR